MLKSKLQRPKYQETNELSSGARPCRNRTSDLPPLYPVISSLHPDLHPFILSPSSFHPFLGPSGPVSGSSGNTLETKPPHRVSFYPVLTTSTWTSQADRASPSTSFHHTQHQIPSWLSFSFKQHITEVWSYLVNWSGSFFSQNALIPIFFKHTYSLLNKDAYRIYHIIRVNMSWFTGRKPDSG